MTQDRETGNVATLRGGPGTLSRWIQRRANERTNGRIRRKGGRSMGMDLLILHTVGRHSGQPRETPVAWFADGAGGWLIVASGGGSRHPNWYLNLMRTPRKRRSSCMATSPWR